MNKTTFPTNLHVRQAKTQISLSFRAVWSESLHGILLTAKDPKRLADSEDSDQQARMRRLISAFAGHKYIFLENLCLGSMSFH